MAGEAVVASNTGRETARPRPSVIVTALAVEARAARRHHAAAEHEDHPRGSVYTRGRFDAPEGPWDLTLPGLIDGWDAERLGNALRDAFNALWRQGGATGSPSFDGQVIGNRRW